MKQHAYGKYQTIFEDGKYYTWNEETLAWVLVSS